MKNFLFAIMLMFVFSACAITEPLSSVRDSVRVEYRLDSIYLYERDSIFVDRWRENDTIYITTDKWHTRYKDVIQVQHDTICVQSESVVAERYVPRFYKICTISLFVLLLLIIAKIIIKIYVKR